jgi:uncharacterized protein (TIGR00251 family)
VVEVKSHPEGAVLNVKALPGARRNGVAGEHAGALKVAVTQVAEKGKANKAVAAVLAKALGVRPAEIELLSGATSARKRFLVRGAGAQELAELVEMLLGLGEG